MEPFMELVCILLELKGLYYIIVFTSYIFVPSPPFCSFPVTGPDVEDPPLLTCESPLGPMLQSSPE